MSDHDDACDKSGFMTLFLGVVVLVAMSCLPATIGWVQVVHG
ncbi:hypothetical protein ACUN9Y_05165 [Halomonas sp. V046]